jgi:hypothetical protein
MVYFVCATPRSFKECYLIDCGDLCNCAKKIYISICSWNAAYESLLGSSNKPFLADWPPSHSTRWHADTPDANICELTS